MLRKNARIEKRGSNVGTAFSDYLLQFYFYDCAYKCSWILYLGNRKNYAIKKIENTKLILELNNSKTTSKLIPQHVALKKVIKNHKSGHLFGSASFLYQSYLEIRLSFIQNCFYLNSISVSC